MKSLRIKSPAEVQPGTAAALPFGVHALELVSRGATLLIAAKSGHCQAAPKNKGLEEEEHRLGDEKREFQNYCRMGESSKLFHEQQNPQSLI